jgi:hypothetical protein
MQQYREYKEYGKIWLTKFEFHQNKTPSKIIFICENGKITIWPEGESCYGSFGKPPSLNYMFGWTIQSITQDTHNDKNTLLELTMDNFFFIFGIDSSTYDINDINGCNYGEDYTTKYIKQPFFIVSINLSKNDNNMKISIPCYYYDEISNGDWFDETYLPNKLVLMQK